MENAAYKSSFASLRETMERCADIVSEAYSKPIEDLEIYRGELPPGHRNTDRRQRYWVTERDGDMYVALPGTTHPLDWSSNLRVHYQPIDGVHVPVDQLESVPCSHAGFYYRAETVPTLELLQRAAARGCRLVLTGHSLGGAVANLCAFTALTAQKRARAAVEEAAAAQSKLSSRSKRKSKYSPDGRTLASAAANKDNHSCCSSNSDVVLSPQAILVEVLCVSFASPVYANAALVKHIEDSGWEECFVNVVVPEDYCLKLFNNVLTSANPAGRTISRTTSRSSFTGSSTNPLEYDSDTTESYEALEPCERAKEPTFDMTASAAAAVTAAVAAATAAQQASSSDDDGSGSVEEDKPRFSYNGQQLQRPLSALAGKNGRSSRSKRQLQLSFAHPIHQTLDDGAECSSTAAAAAATTSQARPQISTLNTARGSNWAEDDHLPSSPSSASLHSDESSSSTRSWTLLAYLPGVFGRSFSSRSLSSWGSSSSSGGGGRESDSGMTAEAAEDVFASWGMRHAKSSVDLTQAFSLSSSDDGSSSGGGTSSGGGCSVCDMDDLEAAAAFFTGVGGMDKTEQQVQQQQKQQHYHAEMRRSYSSASLTIFNQGHQYLSGQPVRAISKVTDSLSIVSRLLPSARSVVTASRTVVSAASNLADKALNVPLDVLEVGLVKALKPPMYQPVGQQWILSATGLVPQHQDILQYPRYVHDVYWHKELMLVAFREHSITFYKQRLLKQASRR